MDTTITIRAPESLRRVLERRARAQRKTISAVAREILEEALAERPMRERTAHLRGKLALGKAAPQTWRDAIRRHNWRP